MLDSDPASHCCRPGQPVAEVLPTRIPGVQLLQRLRYASVRSHEYEVVVVAHQGVGDQAQLEALKDQRETDEEGLALGVAREQVAPVTRVRSEVVDPLEEGARWPWHASRVR